MAGVLPAHILVHTATPVSYVEGSGEYDWIEGEPPVHGVPFECVLFLPAPGGVEDNPYKPRVVRRPTLLYNPDRNVLDPSRGLVGDGSDIIVTNEDELLIDAVELVAWTGTNPARWQASGDSQPFGPPGKVLGVQATLLQVRD
jgi:hypothetical protein